jgi:hypothetical protein
MNIPSPKVFISCGWSTPGNEQRVIELAEQLQKTTELGQRIHHWTFDASFQVREK